MTSSPTNGATANGPAGPGPAGTALGMVAGGRTSAWRYQLRRPRRPCPPPPPSCLCNRGPAGRRGTLASQRGDLRLVPLLKPLGDVESYRFADWRNQAVTLSHARCAAPSTAGPVKPTCSWPTWTPARTRLPACCTRKSSLIPSPIPPARQGWRGRYHGRKSDAGRRLKPKRAPVDRGRSQAHHSGRWRDSHPGPIVAAFRLCRVKLLMNSPGCRRARGKRRLIGATAEPENRLLLQRLLFGGNRPDHRRGFPDPG